MQRFFLFIFYMVSLVTAHATDKIYQCEQHDFTLELFAVGDEHVNHVLKINGNTTISELERALWFVESVSCEPQGFKIKASHLQYNDGEKSEYSLKILAVDEYRLDLVSDNNFVSFDDVIPTNIQHAVEEIYDGGVLRELYNYIYYEFEFKDEYYWARTYDDDFDTVSLFGAFESSVGLRQPVDNPKYKNHIINYLKRRYKVIQEFGEKGYVTIYEDPTRHSVANSILYRGRYVWGAEVNSFKRCETDE